MKDSNLAPDFDQPAYLVEHCAFHFPALCPPGIDRELPICFPFLKSCFGDECG